MEANKNVLVVIDPSTPGGEAALDLVAGRTPHGGGTVTLVATLSGSAADPFRTVADTEGMAIAEAVGAHLARLTAGLTQRHIAAAGLSIPGLDPVVEIATCAVEVAADVVVVPADTAIVDMAKWPAVATLCGVPLLIAPAHPRHRTRRAA